MRSRSGLLVFNKILFIFVFVFSIFSIAKSMQGLYLWGQPVLYVSRCSHAFSLLLSSTYFAEFGSFPPSIAFFSSNCDWLRECRGIFIYSSFFLMLVDDWRRWSGFLLDSLSLFQVTYAIFHFLIIVFSSTESSDIHQTLDCVSDGINVIFN